MSFSDHVVLWLHIAAAIFTIGPGTAAIMSTPRYIRKRNTVVVGYLYRITRIYALGSLLTLIFGLIITQLLHDFNKPWISASITLFVVAAVLTPPDPISQISLAVPTILLYEIAIIAAKMIEKGRSRREIEDQATT